MRAGCNAEFEWTESGSTLDYGTLSKRTDRGAAEPTLMKRRREANAKYFLISRAQAVGASQCYWCCFAGAEAVLVMSSSSGGTRRAPRELD
jgi:hypothetical protein